MLLPKIPPLLSQAEKTLLPSSGPSLMGSVNAMGVDLAILISSFLFSLIPLPFAVNAGRTHAIYRTLFMRGED